jgi:hypothetical protein
MALSRCVGPGAAGVGTSVHVLPSQLLTKPLAPISVQSVAELQDTPVPSAWRPGLGSKDQEVPSQDMDRSWNSLPLKKVPTATHCAADGHETSSSTLVLVLASGLATTDQALPSQVSTRVRSKPKRGRESPTAVQAEGEVQDTWSSPSMYPVSGLGTMDQVEPSQVSTRVSSPCPEMKLPTAVQNVARWAGPPGFRQTPRQFSPPYALAAH